MASLDLGKVMEIVTTENVTPPQAPPAQGLEPQEPVVPGAPGKVATSSATPEAKKEEERVSSKLQTLVRREKVALEKERTAKTKEEQVQAREQALEAREAKVKEFETLSKLNPLKALELLGLSYGELTQIALADGNVPPEMQVKKIEEKVDSLEKNIKEKEEALATAARQAAVRDEERAISEFKTDIKSFLDTNSKKYELIHFDGQHDFVFEIIDEHYRRTIDPQTGIGKIMSIAEAADKLEKALEAKYEKPPEKLKSKFLPTPPQVVKPQNQPSYKPKTLTNNHSATPSRPRTQPITDEERIAKAVAYARGLRS